MLRTNGIVLPVAGDVTDQRVYFFVHRNDCFVFQAQTEAYDDSQVVGGKGYPSFSIVANPTKVPKPVPSQIFREREGSVRDHTTPKPSLYVLRPSIGMMSSFLSGNASPHELKSGDKPCLIFPFVVISKPKV